MAVPLPQALLPCSPLPLCEPRGQPMRATLRSYPSEPPGAGLCADLCTQRSWPCCLIATGRHTRPAINSTLFPALPAGTSWVVGRVATTNCSPPGCWHTRRPSAPLPEPPLHAPKFSCQISLLCRWREAQQPLLALILSLVHSETPAMQNPVPGPESLSPDAHLCSSRYGPHRFPFPVVRTEHPARCNCCKLSCGQGQAGASGV